MTNARARARRQGHALRLLRQLAQKQTVDLHYAAHNWKLATVLTCPEPECSYYRQVIGQVDKLLPETPPKEAVC